MKNKSLAFLTIQYMSRSTPTNTRMMTRIFENENQKLKESMFNLKTQRIERFEDLNFNIKHWESMIDGVKEDINGERRRLYRYQKELKRVKEMLENIEKGLKTKKMMKK